MNPNYVNILVMHRTYTNEIEWEPKPEEGWQCAGDTTEQSCIHPRKTNEFDTYDTHSHPTHTKQSDQKKYTHTNLRINGKNENWEK